MKTRTLLIAAAAATALGLGGYALYMAGMQHGKSMAAPAQSGDPGLPRSIAEGEAATRRHIASGLKAGDVDPATRRKILYYHDPMVPGNKFDKPGKSPFMDMMLVPVYAGAAEADGSAVVVSPRVQQSLGVRTAYVEEGSIAEQITAVGAIAWNERDQAVVQARATGFVERLHVRATLDRVTRGQPLAELFVPDWVAAQEEFLSVRRMQGSDLDALVDAARARMRQAGMSDAQIERVEAGARVQPRFTLTAPLAGVVTELAAREGMTVTAGTTLFRINATATVWAIAEVPESQAGRLRPGTAVRATTPAHPGFSFAGKVQALLPEIDPATRTLKARVEIANPSGRLMPGMTVAMHFADTRGNKALLVPSEAIIQTGRRTVVLLAEDDGRFRPVEVEIGIESGGKTEVKRGLERGQRVVASSQFLIDSEASLRGVEARLNAPQQHDGAGQTESTR